MMVQKGTILSILFILYVSSRATKMANVIPKTLFIPDVERWSKSFWSFASTAHQATSRFAKSTVNTCSDEPQYKDAIVEGMTDRLFQLMTGLEKLRIPYALRTDQLQKLDDKVTAIEEVVNLLLTTMDRIIEQDLDMTELCNLAYEQLYTDPLSIKIEDMYKEWNNIKHDFPSHISDGFENNKDIECGGGHSPNDDLRGIYDTQIMTEIGAYAAIAFNHNLLYSYNGTSSKCSYRQANPNTEMTGVQERLITRLNDYNKIFLSVMSSTTREFRACDNENFIRDETYLELDGAIQIIIHPPRKKKSCPIGPINLFTHALCEDILGDQSSCESVDGYGIPKNYCETSDKFCVTQNVRTCHGRTYNCERVQDLSGCISPEFPRRYVFLRWPENSFLGIPSPSVTDLGSMCGTQTLGFNAPDGGCMCECNDNNVDSISTHIFNLQWVESDISQNMVITGVRFIVQHRVMQLQIQQGILDTHFRVRDPQWKPVNDISEQIRAARLKKKLRGEAPGVIENDDFLVITKGYNNAINFDELMVPHSHVLTGVRFKISSNKEGPPLRIQIVLSSTQFDHQSGKLCLECQPQIVESSRIHPWRYVYPNKNICQPSFPTTQKTSYGQYTLIDISDRLYDGGQTTLPLFDAIPVISAPPAPLGGIGIFHKANDDFTGFISLKLLSLDYSKYMKA